MASVEDCTDTFLRDFCAKGGTVIFLSKALSPTTMPNIQGMLVGELAALWAGATVRLVTSVVCCRVLYGLLTSLRNSGAARRRGIRLGTGVRLTHITAQLEHGSQERNACVWGFGFILTSLRNSGTASRRGMRLGTGVRLTHITAQLGHGLQERNASGGSAYSHHCATRYITVRRRGSVRCYALLTALCCHQWGSTPLLSEACHQDDRGCDG